jgi:hypothetical protein
MTSTNAKVASALEAIACAPVFVDQISEPQVGNAGAADLAEASQWSGVAGRGQQYVYPVAAPLERSSVMRRTEENDLVDAPTPIVARQLAVMAGTADDKSTHAVTDQHEFGHRHRPAVHQRFEQVGERTPVH